jgi:hypothetical protein
MDIAARARLAEWKQSLLDPAERLFDVRDAGVPIAVDSVRLAFSLAAGGTFALEAGVPGLEAGRIGVAMGAAELARELCALDRAARDAAADGEHAVWVALGELAWTDASGVPHVSPLALWPVALLHEGNTVRLTAAAGLSPRANEILFERLRVEHGLSLPAEGPLDLAALLSAAGKAAHERGWLLDGGARLATWSFAAYDLYRDVLAFGDELVARAPVAWLAGAEAPAAMPPAAVEDMIAPLDADASQLAAVAAAGAGASFVLHGAPGTGKSQTIANVLAHCASNGKTVLFVTDRLAALEIVRQRLGPLGLADFCLPLYGEQGTRARVLDTLGRVLDRAFRPGSGPSAQTERHAELRAVLDRHGVAMHVSTALGLSVHDMLGKLVELRTTPRAELAERDAVMLDRAGYERRLAAVEALAEASRAVEPITSHPWRAAAPEGWADGATERASCALDGMDAAIGALAAALAEVGALVPKLGARTPEQLRALGALADLASASPRPGAELLTALRTSRSTVEAVGLTLGTGVDDVGERIALIRVRGGGTLDVPRDPVEFLAIAQRHRALRAEVRESFHAEVDLLDAGELWSQLKRWTTSVAPLRYVALRAVRAEARRAAKDGALATDEAMLTALEAVIAERACREALRFADSPVRRWFGALAGDALALELDKVEAAAAWAVELRRAFDRATIGGGELGRAAAWRALVAQVAAAPDATELGPFARLADAVARWEPALAELALATGIAASALGVGPDHLPALRDQVSALRGAVHALAPWARFHHARTAAAVAGIGPAIAAIERGDLAGAELASAWQRATLLAFAEAELKSSSALASFDGAAHHARVGEFADLDKRSLAVAKSRALARLAERVPRIVGASDVDAQTAALRRERAAEQGLSLRAALAEMPELFAKLTPCVLATPQTIARHLDPALPAFDVVVFDEASRLPVAHALGALARGRAIVVVGDIRQPAPAGGRDGMLERALAARLPELALATHYRSRHPELFTFANRHYYGERLALAPAPARGELGASWVRIDGTADAAGANRAEAEAIVAEIARRARDGRTIAVVAMSRAQQHLIEDLLADARRADAELDAALAGAREPVLVGTPERVQGEERDLALISIGDGADSLGALTLPGGEGWLTVAFTRARLRWIAFSSFAPEDIAAEAPAAARDLAELLVFARDAASMIPAEAPPASPITAAIGRALTERGWIVRHQVGSGAFRIDLAIVDPADPSRYVLAIDHDGATYIGARGARDRDRLRTEQLALRGWRLHRVWSLDWWLDAERETQRAHAAIVAALAAQRRAAQPARIRTARGSAPMPAPLAPTAPVAVAAADLALASGSGPTSGDDLGTAGGSGPSLILGEVTARVVRVPRGAIAIGPYIAAAIPAGRRVPDDMFSTRYGEELGKCVEQVLTAEAPIHLDLLARRVAAYFGVGRIDDRVVDQVRAAVVGRGKLGDEHGIIWRLDQDPSAVPTVRVAGMTASGRRDIGEVPLSELAAAARVVVERANAVGARELVRDCARLLGFARLTDQVSDRVSLGIQLAAARQLIAIEGGRARIPS